MYTQGERKEKGKRKRRGKKEGEKTIAQYTLHTLHTIHTIKSFEYWTLRGETGTKVVHTFCAALPTELRVRMEGTGTLQPDLHDARFSIQVHLNIDMEGSTTIFVHM